MNARSFFHRYRNKIFAIGFASLALIAFFAYYIMEVVRFGFSFFTSDTFSIWNMIVVFIAYAVIFFCNITNDSSAYQGILMFVFMIVAGQILSSFSSIAACFMNFSTQDPAIIALTLLQLAFIVGQIYVGICLYWNSRRYMTMRSDDFKKLRIYGILFTVMLGISHGFSIAVMAIGYGTVFNFAFFCSLFLLPISEVLMAISVNFTLERLRRL